MSDRFVDLVYETFSDNYGDIVDVSRSEAVIEECLQKLIEINSAQDNSNSDEAE